MANTITVKILGDAKNLVGAVDTADSKLGGLGRTAGKIGLAVGAGLATISAGLYKLGSDMDSARDTIIVGTGASSKALDGLMKDFEAVASSVPASFGDVGTAIADVNTRLGLTGKPLQDVSSRMLELSRITKTDLGTNIANITRVFGDAGIAAEDQAIAIDKIFEATKRTGIGLDRLTTLTVQYGAPLRQMGFGFEESLAIFGKWEQEGVNIETVMAGMRAGLGKLAKAGEEPAEAFQRITEEIKNAGSVGEATALAIEAFGQRAGPDMAAAIREGRFEIDELVAGLENSEGALDDAVSRTESWQQKLKVLMNRFMIKFAPLATKMFDAIGKGVDAAAPYLEMFADWLGEKIPPLVERVVGWFKDHWPEIQLVIRDFADYLQNVVWPIAQYVFTKLIEVVGLVVGYILDHWPQIRDAIAAVVDWLVQEAWPVIEEVVDSIIEQFNELVVWVRTYWPEIQATIEAVMGYVQAVTEKVLAVLKKLWEVFGDDIITVVKGAWTIIKTVIDSALDAIKAVIRLVMAVIRGDWSAAWDSIKQLLSAVWDLIKGIIDGGLQIIKGLLSGAWDAIKRTMQTAWDAAKGIVSDAIDGMIGFVEGLPGRLLDWMSSLGEAAALLGGAIWDGLIGAVEGLGDEIWNAIKGGFNAIIGAWNGLSFKLPEVDTHIPGVGKVGGWTISTPDLPYFHNGGYVGSRGGTAQDIPAMLQQGEYVLSRSDVDAILSGRRGDGPLVAIEKAYFNDGADADQLANTISFALG